MTPIRSLDIRRGEAWTPGRISLHMAMATAPDATLVKQKHNWRLWRWLLGGWLILPAFAVSVGLALLLLRIIATH
jgi:hypothetical protein